MFLGNIVTQIDFKTNQLFKIVNNLGEIEKELPTLIIGWEFTKLIFNENKPSILEKQISDNLYWTFTKKERRVDFEEDYKKFIEICLENINDKINYNFVNILMSKQSILKNIISKLTSSTICYIYIKNNSFIYIFDGFEITGVDFNAIDFIKIDRKKIYRILYSNKNDVFFNTDFLPKEIKEKIINRNRLVPYLKTIFDNGK